MRNVFDQYTQPENRLTHALAATLHEDSALLHQFVTFATGKRLKKRQKLIIVEQTLPGEDESYEEAEDSSGLPDIWIHDDAAWCLLVESKVSDSLKTNQLRRHYSTAERRGFTDIHVLAIEAKAPRIKLPDYVQHTTWSAVYSWLVNNASSHRWAGRAAEYFEIAESKFVNDGYLKEGKLTVFTGIPFGRDKPYNYQEAKRLLGLMMDELRADQSLEKRIGLDLRAPGRPAIRGKHGVAVWDFLAFNKAKGAEQFNAFPHCTIKIGQGDVSARLMIPNSLNRPMRKRLSNLTYEEFLGLVGEIIDRGTAVMKLEPGAQPRMSVTQRHFPTRTKAIIDGQVEFDLRTAFGESGSNIKEQDDWVAAAYEAIVNKRSNIEVGVGYTFPYEHCKSLDSRKAVQLVKESWASCEPIFQFLLGG